ncbi:hypothetical protein LPJ66_000277 [Kickxella alabastrina]|uniref:Uncharacterized protein n=1 Tax=Kickxella alabastrina TaxID=61397 RepID=A0ACC1IWJ8_9FUNG|nr:hypothetical protein LPJ66_000277 [Kickxella alabastrina]
MFLTVDPELNKQRRRQLGPTMGLANLKHMEPIIMAAGSKQLCSKWDRAIGQSKDGKTAKLCYHTDFMLMNFDIISSLGFGQAHRSLTSGDTQIVDWVHTTFVLMYLQGLFPFIKSKVFRQFIIKPLYDKYDAFFAVGTQAIEKRKQLLSNLKPGDSKPKDLLQSYIDAEDPESRIRMTSGQVATETINGLMAGSDTSSTNLTATT